MRVKAKTWGVIGKHAHPIYLRVRSRAQRGVLGPTKTKSQLQTVLITASGPQAYNALVHRERYTQGSRQNRCVSSQEALALRAKVVGAGRHGPSCGWPSCGCCNGFRSFALPLVTTPPAGTDRPEAGNLLPTAPHVALHGVT